MKTKQVEYAHPTSDNAKKFQCGSTGCWVILVGEGDMCWPHIARYGGQTEFIAVNRAYALPHPWSRYWLWVKSLFLDNEPPSDCERLDNQLAKM